MVKNLIFLALKVVTTKQGYDAGYTMAQSEILHADAYNAAQGKITSVGDDGTPVYDETYADDLTTEMQTFIKKSVEADPVANTNVPDATNEASAVTLVNDLKLKLNTLLTNMRAAGTLEDPA